MNGAMKEKIISVVSPCYNEEGNVGELYLRVKRVIASLGGYAYEHIFIDNASSDGTVAILRRLAQADRNVKLIINSRNFGHLRSPAHALYQASGDAVVGIAADLQEPPELIADMVRAWESGVPIVIGRKTGSDENRLMYWIRTRYYRLVRRFSAIETYEHFTGFGLYDRKVVDLLKSFSDPYPYLRGMIAEIGLAHVEIPFRQSRRKKGRTKNNIYTLYDLAMLGITSLSKVPLRIVTFSGFAGALTCMLVAFVYFIYKLAYWDRFSVGVAPLVIGIFFVASLQLVFLGIVGEYVGAIHTIVQGRPLVIERERINFEYGPGDPDRADEIPPQSSRAAAGQ